MSDNAGSNEPTPDAPSEDAAALEQPPRVRDRIARFALEGGKLLAVAAQKITSRTLWWGGWGLLTGIAVFVSIWWPGMLAVPWPAAQPWVTALGALYFPIVGAACWGHGGFYRGIGRFALVVGVERGWVVSLVASILDRTLGLLQRSERIDGVLHRVGSMAEELPLHRWESALKGGAQTVLGEHQAEARGVMAWVRGWVIRQIEKVMLRIVRAEFANGRGGGVSMKRVREVMFELVEAKFRELVLGMMNKQLALMTALFAGLSALPPLLAALARWWVG